LIRTVKRLMDLRQYVGKQRDGTRTRKTQTSADSLVAAYRRESQRQRTLIRKARVCEAKLLFIVTAFAKLLADENFITLLRAENLSQMPKYLHEKLTKREKEAA